MCFAKRLSGRLVVFFPLLAIAIPAIADNVYRIDASVSPVVVSFNNTVIGGACVGDVCFVTIPLAQNSPSNALDAYGFEDQNNNVEWYMTFQEFKGENTAELRFFPAGVAIPPPLPDPLPPLDATLPETVNYQTVFKVTPPKLAANTDFDVRFPPPPVSPEPSVLSLTAAGIALSAAAMIRRKGTKKT